MLKVPADRLWFKLPGEVPEPATVLTAAQPDTTDAPEPVQQALGGVLLPVVINGHPVLVPVDAATVAASGLGMLLDELTAGVTPETSVPAAEWKVMSPLNRRSLLAQGIAAAALPALGLEELQRVAAALDDARRVTSATVPCEIGVPNSSASACMSLIASPPKTSTNAKSTSTCPRS